MRKTAWQLVAVALLSAGLTAAGVWGYRAWQRSRAPKEPLIGNKARAQWLEALNSDSPEEGRAAAHALADLGEPGLAVLLEARTSPDLRVHRRAVAGLVRVGGPAAPGLVEVLPKSGDRAETALVRIGPAAVPALVAALRQPERAKHAARVLGAMGARAGAAVPDLVAVFLDRQAKDEARAEAARALGRIGPAPPPADAPGTPDAVVEALASALTDGSAAVRQRAAEGLGEIGPRAVAALPALARASRDPEAEVSASACWALGHLASPPGAPALLARVLGEDDPRQLPAAEALAQLGPAARGTIPALVAVLASPRAERAHAAFVLERLGPPAVPALIEAIQGPERDLRRAAADVLAKLGPQATAALPAVLAALEDRSAPATLGAPFVGLGALPSGPLTCCAALVAYEEGQARLPLALARCAVRIDPTRAGPAVPALLRLLDGKYGGDVVLLLADVGEGARAAVPLLLASLKGKDQARAQRAALALARLGPSAREAVPDLLPLLADRALRPYAAAALARIDPARDADVLKALTPDLEGEDAGACRRALAALREMERVPAEALPLLRPLLSDGELVHPALALVERLGKDAAPATLDLIKLLSESSPLLRERAGRLLARIGRPAAGPLTTALRSPNPTVRATAAWTMGRAALTDRPTAQSLYADALVPALEDSDLSVRLQAAASLALLRIPTADHKAIPILLGWLDRSEADHRRAGVRALAVAPLSPSARARVAECLLSPDELVRHGAARAVLGPSPTSEALEELAGALNDGSAAVRLASAIALLAVDPKRGAALSALAGLTRSPIPALRQEAVEAALRVAPRLGAEAVPLLEADVRGGDLFQRHRAALLLVRIDATKARTVVPWLMAQLQSLDAGARVEACRTLEQLGPAARAALPALRRRANDENENVRAAAKEALKQVRANGP